MSSTEDKSPPAEAERELEQGLRALGEALKALPEQEAPKARPIYEALEALSAAMGKKESEGFLRGLVRVASETIDVRQANPGSPLGSLPVIPYDLWLPFKAVKIGMPELRRSLWSPFNELVREICEQRPKSQEKTLKETKGSNGGAAGEDGPTEK